MNLQKNKLKIVLPLVVVLAVIAWGLFHSLKKSEQSNTQPDQETTQNQSAVKNDSAQPEATSSDEQKSSAQAGSSQDDENTAEVATIPSDQKAPAKPGFFARLFGSKEASLPNPSAPGANGGAGVDSSNAGKDAVAMNTPVKPAAPDQTCFVYTYKHRSLASHPDGEACSHHKNLLKLRHANINFKSLCVRVNGNPVKFQTVKGKADQILLAAIAGPHAKITTSYCLQGHNCVQDCSIPKDEFMDAIGAVEDSGKGDRQIAQWDPADKDQDQDVTSQLGNDFAKDISGVGSSTVFEDWIPGEIEAPSCGKSTASLNTRS